MEQKSQYEEWLFQSDYDLGTAYQMLQTGRNIYCIFMCHLSLEKVLKGLFVKRLGEFPPKTHSLNYIVNKINLTLAEDYQLFMKKIDSLSIVTRYPEDLRAMITLYSQKQTTDIYEQTKMIQRWLKQQ